MLNYTQGQKITIESSTGKVVTWVATGDEQRDRALSIQIRQAAECLEWTYILGATNIENHIVDCSGLTHYLYSLVDVDISNLATTQHKSINGEEIYNYKGSEAFDVEKLQTGDILTFNSNGKEDGHVAFYLGDGYFIHSANPADDVIIGSFFSEYSNGYEYETDTHMVVTGTYHHWGENLTYVTRFGDNIYVNEDNTVVNARVQDNDIYAPAYKENGKMMYEKRGEHNTVTDVGHFEDDEFISYSLRDFIAESVNASNLSDAEKERITEQMYKIYSAGGRATLKSREFKSNGTFIASDDGADGFDRVTVNVAQGNMNIFDIFEALPAAGSADIGGGYKIKICKMPDGDFVREIKSWGEYTADNGKKYAYLTMHSEGLWYTTPGIYKDDDLIYIAPVISSFDYKKMTLYNSVADGSPPNAVNGTVNNIYIYGDPVFPKNGVTWSTDFERISVTLLYERSYKFQSFNPDGTLNYDSEEKMTGNSKTYTIYLNSMYYGYSSLNGRDFINAITDLQSYLSELKRNKY
ncbi:MAG: NlpC/P60 family protein [Ruminococcus sp.]|nr:NlpC/P60 family protein [Ruminococcus sp.]